MIVSRQDGRINQKRRTRRAIIEAASTLVRAGKQPSVAEAADAALARLEAEYAGTLAFEIAETYAFRGQKDAAFKWLDRAYTQRDTELFLVKGDPLLKNLGGDQRHSAFLQKMSLPE